MEPRAKAGKRGRGVMGAPLIQLPEPYPCPKCHGTGKVTVEVGKVKAGDGFADWIVGEPIFGFADCDCDGGKRYDLGDLKRAADVAGVRLSTAYLPSEAYPEDEYEDEYVAEIICAEGRSEAWGASYEAAAVAVIEKWNQEVQRCQKS